MISLLQFDTLIAVLCSLFDFLRSDPTTIKAANLFGSICKSKEVPFPQCQVQSTIGTSTVLMKPAVHVYLQYRETLELRYHVLVPVPRPGTTMVKVQRAQVHEWSVRQTRSDYRVTFLLVRTALLPYTVLWPSVFSELHALHTSQKNKSIITSHSNLFDISIFTRLDRSYR